MSGDSIQSKNIRYNNVSESIITDEINNLEYNEFNSDTYPWKINTTYILHDNTSIDISDYSFTKENYLLIESKTSDIKFKTINQKKIIFDSSVNFNSIVGLSEINSNNINNSNNIITSYINSTNARFTNIQLDGQLTLTNQSTTNIKGTINLEGQIFINGSSDITGDIGVSNAIINNATINNTIIGLDISNNANFKNLRANNLDINNHLTTKNIDINENININNNLIIANNIYLKNKKFDNIENITLSHDVEMNIGFTKNSNGRSIEYSDTNQPLKNYKFILKKGKYTINTGLIIVGNTLFYNNLTQYIGFEVENDVSYNFVYKGHSQSGIKYYRKLTFDSTFTSDYRGNKNINDFYSGLIDIDVFGNFGYVNISVYNAETSIFDEVEEFKYNYQYNIDKIFVYEHDINLIETLENIDISLDNILTSYRDSSFNNVDLSNIIVKNDLKLNYLDASNIPFLNNDKKIIGNNNFKFKDIDSQLITYNLLVNNNQTIINDLSINNNLYVNQNADISGLKVFNRFDVSYIEVSNNLFVKNDLSVNNKLDVSGLKILNRLDVTGDVSFNANLHINNNTLIQHDLSVNNQVDVSGLNILNKLNVKGDSIFDSGLVTMKNDLVIEGDTRTVNRQTNGELFVHNDASFNSNIIIKNDISLNRDLKMNGVLYGPSIFIIDPSKHHDNTGELRIKGNLVVEGSKTVINSSILDISDHTILLASNASTSADTEGAGIEISGNKLFTYSHLNDSWNSNINLNVNRDAIIDNNLTVNNRLNVMTDAVINELTIENDLYAKNETIIDGSLNLKNNFNIYSDSGYRKVLQIKDDSLVISNNNIGTVNKGGILLDGSVTINGNLDLTDGGQIISTQTSDIAGGFIYNTPIGIDNTSTIKREKGFFTNISSNSVGVKDYFIFEELLEQPDVTYYKANLDVSHITVAEGASVGKNFTVGQDFTVIGKTNLNNEVDLSGTLILKTSRSDNKVLNVKNKIDESNILDTLTILKDGTFTSIGDINLSSSNKTTTINSILNVKKQLTIDGILNQKNNIKLGNDDNYTLINIDSEKNLKITPFSDNGINNGNINLKGNINVYNKINLYNTNEDVNSKGEIFAEQNKITIKPHTNSNGTVIIDGNLSVLGTQTTINSTVIELSDNIILLNANADGINTGGINIDVGQGSSQILKTLEYNKTNSRWEFDNGSSTIHASHFTGSANKLKTAREIGGVSFDGTADINLPGVNIKGNQDTTGNASTATKITTIDNSNIVQLNSQQSLTNKFFDDKIHGKKLVISSNIEDNEKFIIDISNDHIEINSSFSSATIFKTPVEFLETPIFPGNKVIETQNIGGGNIYNTIIGYSLDDIEIGRKSFFTTTKTQNLIVEDSINFYDSAVTSYDLPTLNAKFNTLEVSNNLIVHNNTILNSNLTISGEIIVKDSLNNYTSGTIGQVLVSRGSGKTPEWISNVPAISFEAETDLKDIIFKKDNEYFIDKWQLIQSSLDNIFNNNEYVFNAPRSSPFMILSNINLDFSFTDTTVNNNTEFKLYKTKPLVQNSISDKIINAKKSYDFRKVINDELKLNNLTNNIVNAKKSYDFRSVNEIILKKLTNTISANKTYDFRTVDISNTKLEQLTNSIVNAKKSYDFRYIDISNTFNAGKIPNVLSDNISPDSLYNKHIRFYDFRNVIPPSVYISLSNDIVPATKSYNFRNIDNSSISGSSPYNLTYLNEDDINSSVSLIVDEGDVPEFNTTDGYSGSEKHYLRLNNFLTPPHLLMTGIQTRLPPNFAFELYFKLNSLGSGLDIGDGTHDQPIFTLQKQRNYNYNITEEQFIRLYRKGSEDNILRLRYPYVVRYESNSNLSYLWTENGIDFSIENYNQFQHILITFVDGIGVTVYLNGSQVGINSSGITDSYETITDTDYTGRNNSEIIYPTQLVLGRAIDRKDDGTDHDVGIEKIQFFRYYERQITAEQANNLYVKHTTTSLSFNNPLTETNSLSFYTQPTPLRQNGYVTYSGNPDFDRDVGYLHKQKNSNYLYFRKEDITYTLQANVERFTIEFVIKIPELPQGHSPHFFNILTAGGPWNGSNHDLFQFHLQSPNQTSGGKPTVGLHVSSTSGWATVTENEIWYDPNKYHHFVITYLWQPTPEGFKIYRDGELVKHAYNRARLIANDIGSSTFGNCDAKYIRFYQERLTDTQIRTLYYDSFTKYDLNFDTEETQSVNSDSATLFNNIDVSGYNLNNFNQHFDNINGYLSSENHYINLKNPSDISFSGGANEEFALEFLIKPNYTSSEYHSFTHADVFGANATIGDETPLFAILIYSSSSSIAGNYINTIQIQATNSNNIYGSVHFKQPNNSNYNLIDSYTPFEISNTYYQHLIISYSVSDSNLGIMKLYLDGELMAESENIIEAKLKPIVPEEIKIGRGHSYIDRGNEVIKFFRYYDISLTDLNVKELYLHHATYNLVYSHIPGSVFSNSARAVLNDSNIIKSFSNNVGFLGNTNNYIKISGSEIPLTKDSNNDSFSLEFYLNINDKSDHYIFSSNLPTNQNNQNNNNELLTISIENTNNVGNIIIRGTNNNNEYVTFAESDKFNYYVFQHIIIVYTYTQGISTFQIYINGKLKDYVTLDSVEQINTKIINTEPSSILIGRNYAYPPLYTDSSTSSEQIQFFRYYNYALDIINVEQLYYSHAGYDLSFLSISDAPTNDSAIVYTDLSNSNTQSIFSDISGYMESSKDYIELLNVNDFKFISSNDSGWAIELLLKIDITYKDDETSRNFERRILNIFHNSDFNEKPFIELTAENENFNNKIKFKYIDTNVNDVTITNDISFDIFQHIVITCDNSGVNIYINGRFSNSDNNPVYNYTAHNIVLGRAFYHSGDNTLFDNDKANQTIKFFRYYENNLTKEDVKQLYYQHATYNLEFEIYDGTAINNTAKLFSNSHDLPIFNDISGYSGNKNYFIDLPDTSDFILPIGGWSIEFIVKFSSNLNTNEVFLAFYKEINSEFIKFTAKNDKTIELKYMDQNDVVNLTNIDICYNTFEHFIITFNDYYIKIYKNGIQTKIKNIEGNAHYPVISDIIFGKNYYLSNEENLENGTIKFFRYYEKYLSDEEISELYYSNMYYNNAIKLSSITETNILTQNNTDLNINLHSISNLTEEDNLSISINSTQDFTLKNNSKISVATMSGGSNRGVQGPPGVGLPEITGTPGQVLTLDDSTPPVPVWSSNVNIGVSQNIEEDVSLNNLDISYTLNVKGDASFNNNLDVSGNLNVKGDVSFNNLDINGIIALNDITNTNITDATLYGTQGQVLTSGTDASGNLGVPFWRTVPGFAPVYLKLGWNSHIFENIGSDINNWNFAGQYYTEKAKVGNISWDPQNNINAHPFYESDPSGGWPTSNWINGSLEHNVGSGVIIIEPGTYNIKIQWSLFIPGNTRYDLALLRNRKGVLLFHSILENENAYSSDGWRSIQYTATAHDCEYGDVLSVQFKSGSSRYQYRGDSSFDSEYTYMEVYRIA